MCLYVFFMYFYLIVARFGAPERGGPAEGAWHLPLNGDVF